MIDTFSKFIYGPVITRQDKFLSYSEGGAEIISEIDIGSYTLGELVFEVQERMRADAGLIYTVTADRGTRLVTVSADGPFEMLLDTGSTLESSLWKTLGFNQGVDLTGANSYTGDTPAFKEYSPQFKLQSYVAPENNKRLASSTINVNTLGAVEVVSFGSEQFIELDIKFISNLVEIGDGRLLRSNPTGYDDALDFFSQITQKTRFEFFPDENDENFFYKCIVEQTTGFRDGTGFKLKELFNQGLPNIYESGIVTLRVV